MDTVVLTGKGGATAFDAFHFDCCLTTSGVLYSTAGIETTCEPTSTDLRKEDRLTSCFTVMVKGHDPYHTKVVRSAAAMMLDPFFCHWIHGITIFAVTR